MRYGVVASTIEVAVVMATFDARWSPRDSHVRMEAKGRALDEIGARHGAAVSQAAWFSSCWAGGARIPGTHNPEQQRRVPHGRARDNQELPYPSLPFLIPLHTPRVPPVNSKIVRQDGAMLAGDATLAI